MSRGIITETLRKEIKIQEQSISRNSFGEEEISWVDFSSSIRADARTLSMRERFAAQQVQSNIEVKFIMRYRDGIEPKMRVIFNDLSYDIESIINHDERNHKLTLLCSRVST